ncbi:Antitoxin component YwqK of the YwqJK toxin-antitoxin module [Fibrobacter sp. UWP2]|nr:Antitoxin component YwqK of the YwqJK toxin-antitoxin module [Fibrobacter sp. UWP2]
MLHFSAMKNLFFVLFACCGFINALAAEPEAPVSTLDTVKTMFDDGSLARLYTVRHGTDVREGVSWTYHPNGKLAIEVPYKDGKMDGVFRSYYESGKVWQTIGYRGGIEEGFSTSYYENGKKQSRESYKNGVLDGVSEEYDERGLVRRKIPYVNGHIHGKAQVYDDLGALKEEMTFENGLRNGTYRRYQKGVKVLEAEFQANRCVKNCDF